MRRRVSRDPAFSSWYSTIPSDAFDSGDETSQDLYKYRRSAG